MNKDCNYCLELLDGPRCWSRVRPCTYCEGRGHHVMPRSFDYAMPQDWVIEVARLTKMPVQGIVWSYDALPNGGHNTFGWPYAYTDQGKEVLAKVPEVMGGTLKPTSQEVA